jgi:HTH-type transcriptional repressor of NAD biosynthesis genes
MTQRFVQGLVVGKFSPLHLGHEYLIEFAKNQCEQLLVLSYSKPDLPRCPAHIRSGWLCRRFSDVQVVVLDDAMLADRCRQVGIAVRTLPDNNAPDDVHRDFVAWFLSEHLVLSVDAVFTSESYGDGFAQSLSRHQQTCMSYVANVVHVCVDLHRQRYPVSGTAIRTNPSAWRKWVSSAVYADLLPRLCILGAESSGKTTLAAALAQALNTVWVKEYGREYWDLVRRNLTQEELLQVARTQITREEDAAQFASTWLVCDTSPLTTLQYCLLDHASAPDELMLMAQRSYDLVLLCDTDFVFVQDGTRRDSSFSRQQHANTIAALNTLRVDYLVVAGTVTNRVETVMRRLQHEGLSGCQ